MMNIDNLSNALDEELFTEWNNNLSAAVDDVLQRYTHGELQQWLAMIDALPEIELKTKDLNERVGFTSQASIDDLLKQDIIDHLMQLHPWRKGPFFLDNIHLDTEWRSDWKWDRVAPHLSDMSQQTVLDVGCGNGYHLFRMSGMGARVSIGIDPSQKFHAQFLAINHFMQVENVWHLPVALEDLPPIKGFDKVFSMGVLYHRRSPIDHIRQLKSFVRKGGELILETLVVDGDESTVFVPRGRYAQMRNVWFLPSTAALSRWLERCDLADVTLVDVNQTSLEEQRSTDWMTFYSLENYLDPNDINLTIEGYPAPKRATFVARVID